MLSPGTAEVADMVAEVVDMAVAGSTAVAVGFKAAGFVPAGAVVDTSEVDTLWPHLSRLDTSRLDTSWLDMDGMVGLLRRVRVGMRLREMVG
jgi:hypothetical protein